MKKIAILTIVTFFTFSAFAGVSSYQERVDNWLKKDSPSNSGGIDDDDNPTDDPTVGGKSTPIGEGVFILSLFAGSYALINRERNLKKAKKHYIIKR